MLARRFGLVGENSMSINHLQTRGRKRRAGRRAISQLEALESRLLLSTTAYTVSPLGQFNGPNGESPVSTLALDSNGNIWGTAQVGGLANDGTVFEILSGTHSIKTIASFDGNDGDGAFPQGAVVFDSSGNLWGTTANGGANSDQTGGDGVLFEIPAGTSSIVAVASFNAAVGYDPASGLSIDTHGNLFGTANVGGDNSAGSVFELASGSTNITEVAAFGVLSGPNNMTSNGANPQSVLTIDSKGDLFGTTTFGGDLTQQTGLGDGVVFEVANGTSSATALAQFDGNNGLDPYSGVVLDSNGNLFGASEAGGTTNAGTIYEVPNGGGVALALASFSGGVDGSGPNTPWGQIIMDSSGNIYGTAVGGGDPSAGLPGAVYEYVASDSSIVTVVSLGGGAGAIPYEGLIADSNGNLYGTANQGGIVNGGSPSGYGTVFEVSNTHLAFTTAPANSTASLVLTPIKVALEDPGNNVLTASSATITLSLASGTAGTLGGGLTVVAVNGIATFSAVQLETAGTYQLTAADTADNISGPTTASFVISAGPASRLAITSNPSTGFAGQALQKIIVTLEDSAGNPATNDHTTVTLAKHTGPGTGTIGGILTAAVVNGAATFADIVITTAGSYTLVASDSQDHSTSNPSSSVVVLAGEPSKVVITKSPVSTSAGTILMQASIEDQYNNVVTNSNATVTMGIVKGAGTLSGILTAATLNGVATFSAAKATVAGTYVIKAYSGTLVTASTASIVISPDASSQLVFISIPANATAGTVTTLVEIEDQYGNKETADHSTMTILLASSTAAHASLGGTVEAAAINGIATFTKLLLTKSGSYTLAATDVGDGLSQHFLSAGFNVGAAAATQVVFIGEPSSTTAGVSISGLSVDIEDQYGNIVSSNSSTVTLGLLDSPSGSKITGPVTAKANAGIANFSPISLRAAGSYIMDATDGTLTKATTKPFTILPGTAKDLGFTVEPANMLPGKLPVLKVAVEDTLGNVITNAPRSIVTLSFATSLTSYSLTGTLTATTVNGIATFSNLTLTTNGPFHIVASDGTYGKATSTSFNVHNLGSATKLGFTSVPNTGSAGVDLSAIKVSVEDSYGDVITSNTTSTITLSLLTHPSGSSFTGTLTEKVINGVATFANLETTKTGTYTFKATTTGGLTAGTSSPIVVGAGAPTKLVFVVEPKNDTSAATVPTFDVAIEDKFGNICTTANNDIITLSLASATPSTGKLDGTIVVAPINGVATFSKVVMSAKGVYTLHANAKNGATTLTEAVSSSFSVN